MNTDRRQVSRATLATQVEDAIRLEIVEGQLHPGQRLRSSELAERYGVSATPLREALQRLAAENLVDYDPRLGATVAQISRADLQDIYWLREVLEGLALELSIRNGDSNWEQALHKAWQQFQSVAHIDEHASTEDMVQWSRRHHEFHSALYAAANSAWLLRFIDTLYEQSERYRMLSVRSRLGSTTEEHGGVYGPAIARESGAAVEWLRAHFRKTVADLEEGLEPLYLVATPSDERAPEGDGGTGRRIDT